MINLLYFHYCTHKETWIFELPQPLTCLSNGQLLQVCVSGL